MKPCNIKEHNEKFVSVLNSLMQPGWDARNGEWTDKENKGFFVVFTNNESTHKNFDLRWDKVEYQPLTMDFIKDSLDNSFKPTKGAKEAFAKAYERHELLQDLNGSLRVNTKHTRTAKLKV